jgi:Tol biopolymer transport system component
MMTHLLLRASFLITGLMALLVASTLTVGQILGGDMLAFVSNRSGYAELYVMDVDLGMVYQLTDSYWFKYNPVWSPDGAQIAFVTWINNSMSEIDVIDASGWNLRRLSSDPQIIPALTWLPDSAEIMYGGSHLGRAVTYIMNADGTNRRRLSERMTPDGGRLTSPDESRIVFATEYEGNQDIYIMNADGSQRRRLTFDPGVDFDPVWRPE